MADKADAKILQLSTIDIVLNLHCESMSTFFNDTFGQAFINFWDKDVVALRVAVFKIHADHLHVERGSLVAVDEDENSIFFFLGAICWGVACRDARVWFARYAVRRYRTKVNRV